MNILVVQESDWIKRNPHQQHHIMERLSLRGHQIRVIDYEIDWKTTEIDGLIGKRTVFKNVHKIHEESKVDVIRPTLVKIPVLCYLSWAASNWREINRQIDEFKPDVIIGFGLLNTYLACRAAKKRRIPFIYYIIDVLYKLIPEKNLQFIGKNLKKRVLKNSDLVIAINKELAEFAVNLGSDEENTIVIGAGVDLDQFNHQIDGSSIRKLYEVTEEDILLFFMGWIYPFAGVKEIAEELGKKRPENVKLLVVGDGDAFDDLLKIKEKYQMDGTLILTGKQPYNKIPEYIAASDICMLPAYPDELIIQYVVPIKIYEYMAMGKPVIVTSLQGIIKEFGTDNGLTFIKKPEEALNILNKINIIENGKKTRNLVKDNDWENIISIFEKTLEDIT